MYDLKRDDYLALSSSYMDGAFKDPEYQIARAREKLCGVDFDTIVGTGLSGALVVPLLGRGLGVHWAVVRKPGDNSHSSVDIEGKIGHRWLFVDDFVDSGATRDRVRRTILDAVERANEHRDEPFDITFVGTYTYEYGGFLPPEAVARAAWKLDVGSNASVDASEPEDLPLIVKVEAGSIEPAVGREARIPLTPSLATIYDGQ